MQSFLTSKPRDFTVGENNDVTIKDYGKVQLLDNEMITLVTSNTKCNDIVCKSWGIYPTQSLNFRQRNEGFKTALICSNDQKRLYIPLVDTDKMESFFQYLKKHDKIFLQWLDDFI